MIELLSILLTISACLNVGLWRSNKRMNREIGIAAGIIVKERRSRDIDVKQKVVKTIFHPN